MGQPAVRFGDMHSGHQCFPPTTAIQGSTDVKINGLAAVRTGDQFVTHACGKPHPVYAGQGSTTVMINNLPAMRVGDPTQCTAVIITGSSNVLIG